MFKIGDKIVYPMHGAGVIEDIEEHEILGEQRKYYVLKMPIGNMKLMIPINSMEELGIRYVIDSSEIDKVIRELSVSHIEQNTNWNKRYRENMSRIKSGNIYEVADVYKILAERDMTKGLSTGERKMFCNARQILFSELIIAGNYTLEEVEKLVRDAICGQRNILAHTDCSDNEKISPENISELPED